jgi:hypothetical protein
MPAPVTAASQARPRTWPPGCRCRKDSYRRGGPSERGSHASGQGAVGRPGLRAPACVRCHQRRLPDWHAVHMLTGKIRRVPSSGAHSDTGLPWAGVLMSLVGARGVSNGWWRGVGWVL